MPVPDDAGGSGEAGGGGVRVEGRGRSGGGGGAADGGAADERGGGRHAVSDAACLSRFPPCNLPHTVPLRSNATALLRNWTQRFYRA